MLARFRKHLKKLSLSVLTGGLALALGLLLLVPEDSFGETKTKRNLQPVSQGSGAKKKMNHGNRAVMTVNRYDIQRPVSGPTDVMKRRERTLGELTTNVIARVSEDGTTHHVMRVTHKSSKETPSGVNRVGRKGKREQKQKEALEKLRNGDPSQGFRKTSSSTNDIDSLRWQVAAPPTGTVNSTVSAPRAAAGGERLAAERERSRARRSAARIKESQRIDGTNALPRAMRPRRNALSADGDAETTD